MVDGGGAGRGVEGGGRRAGCLGGTTNVSAHALFRDLRRRAVGGGSRFSLSFLLSFFRNFLSALLFFLGQAWPK